MAESSQREAVDRSGDLTAEELMREQRLQRNLKILVATLGMMIVAGLGAVVFRLFTLPSKIEGGSVPIVATTVGTEAIAALLPPGARVVSISLSGSRLAVHYESPGDSGVAVIEVETGRRVLTISTDAATK